MTTREMRMHEVVPAGITVAVVIVGLLALGWVADKVGEWWNRR